METCTCCDTVYYIVGKLYAKLWKFVSRALADTLDKNGIICDQLCEKVPLG